MLEFVEALYPGWDIACGYVYCVALAVGGVKDGLI